MIASLDPAWFRRAAEHQARLTMPAGALGRLLELGRLLCAVQETLRPCTDPAAVLVMAADHGVAVEGVSAYPQEVTGQMVANFLRGGAAINVLASYKAVNMPETMASIYSSEQDPQVKRSIVNQLAGQRSAKSLVDIYHKETDPKLKLEIVTRLRDMRTPEATALFEEILK